MDNRFIVCLVMGAIALAAIAIFATNPTGQAMLKYATTTLPGAQTIPAETASQTVNVVLNEGGTYARGIPCLKKYTIEAIEINTAVAPWSVKFKVNGETLDSLITYQQYGLSDFSTITVKNIWSSSGVDMVQFDFYCSNLAKIPA